MEHIHRNDRTACPANLTFFFGDTEGIEVSFTDDGRVSFAKEGEYVGGKYAGRVLTDEQYLTDEEEVVEQVATFEEFSAACFCGGVGPDHNPGYRTDECGPNPGFPLCRRLSIRSSTRRRVPQDDCLRSIPRR